MQIKGGNLVSFTMDFYDRRQFYWKRLQFFGNTWTAIKRKIESVEAYEPEPKRFKRF